MTAGYRVFYCLSELYRPESPSGQASYITLDVNMDGKKDLRGLYSTNNDGAEKIVYLAIKEASKR